MQKIQWNTGRHYDEYGQRMVAEVREDKIKFSDLSRHINGSIPLGDFMQGRDMDKYDIEALVMVNYDHGNYSGSNDTLEWVAFEFGIFLTEE
jgi:hypothetical protein